MATVGVGAVGGMAMGGAGGGGRASVAGISGVGAAPSAIHIVSETHPSPTHINNWLQPTEHHQDFPIFLAPQATPPVISIPKLDTPTNPDLPQSELSSVNPPAPTPLISATEALPPPPAQPIVIPPTAPTPTVAITNQPTPVVAPRARRSTRDVGTKNHDGTVNRAYISRPTRMPAAMRYAVDSSIKQDTGPFCFLAHSDPHQEGRMYGLKASDHMFALEFKKYSSLVAPDVKSHCPKTSRYTLSPPPLPPKELSVRRALRCSNSDNVMPAIELEMTKLGDTYRAIRPININDIDADAVRIRSRMFVKEKFDGSGLYTKTSARLAAGGNNMPSDSYTDTHALTVDETYKNLAIAAFYADAIKNGYLQDMHMSDFDIPGAFLNTELNKSNCPRQIVMFIQNAIPHKLAGTWVEVLRGVYGLKQSNHIFEKELCEVFASAGFSPTPSEPSI